MCDSVVCGAEMATMDPLCRAKVVEELLSRRLLRKSRRVLELWEASARDWNQTLYAMTCYAMGAPRNSQPFQMLAERVTYLMCLRERTSCERVEAMLLGAAGLLRSEYLDNHLVELQSEYEYLACKYGIQGMSGGEWRRAGNFPASSPVVRVVQLASIVAKDDYSVDSLLALRSLEEVERLFGVSVGDYWRHRLKVEYGTGHIGKEKIGVMAINLVVPVQFAYGEVMHDERLKLSALDLLEQVPAEHNRLVARWTGAGVAVRSAYDSQALIELSQLCDERGCKECPLAKQLKKV